MYDIHHPRVSQHQTTRVFRDGQGVLIAERPPELPHWATRRCYTQPRAPVLDSGRDGSINASRSEERAPNPARAVDATAVRCTTTACAKALLLTLDSNLIKPLHRGEDLHCGWDACFYAVALTDRPCMLWCCVVLEGGMVHAAMECRSGAQMTSAVRSQDARLHHAHTHALN